MTWWTNGGIPIIKGGKAVVDSCNCCGGPTPTEHCAACDNGNAWRSYAVDLTGWSISYATGACQACLDLISAVWVCEQANFPPSPGAPIDCQWSGGLDVVGGPLGGCGPCSVLQSISIQPRVPTGHPATSFGVAVTNDKWLLGISLSFYDPTLRNMRWYYTAPKASLLDCSEETLTFTLQNHNTGYNPAISPFPGPTGLDITPLDPPSTLTITAATS